MVVTVTRALQFWGPWEGCRGEKRQLKPVEVGPVPHPHPGLRGQLYSLLWPRASRPWGWRPGSPLCPGVPCRRAGERVCSGSPWRAALPPHSHQARTFTAFLSWVECHTLLSHPAGSLPALLLALGVQTDPLPSPVRCAALRLPSLDSFSNLPTSPGAESTQGRAGLVAGTTALGFSTMDSAQEGLGCLARQAAWLLPGPAHRPQSLRLPCSQRWRSGEALPQEAVWLALSRERHSPPEN